MTDILIDNQNVKTVFGITVLDYTGILSIASERENERVWEDKSGVDKNLQNIRYAPREFVIECIIQASNEVGAYNIAKNLTTYMFEKGVFVLSLRDATQGIRECYLCERSGTIVANVHIREQNSLYTFKLGLKDINPNALKFYNTIVGNSASITYEKGQTADLYWGNGDRGLVSNSGNYQKSDYIENGPVDIVIDIDGDADTISPLSCSFSANLTSGAKILDVQFTDTSIGIVEIWSWDFGDGYTSSSQSPLHSYTNEGTYTVTLQVFNSAGGVDTETKVDYITVVNSALLINDAGDKLLINDSGDTLLIN